MHICTLFTVNIHKYHGYIYIYNRHMCMYIYITHIQAPVKLLYIPTSY